MRANTPSRQQTSLGHVPARFHLLSAAAAHRGRRRKNGGERWKGVIFHLPLFLFYLCWKGMIIHIPLFLFYLCWKGMIIHIPPCLFYLCWKGMMILIPPCLFCL